MSLQTLIDRLVPDCSGWGRSTGQRNLLDLIEQGMDELTEYDAEQMIYTDPDNEGFPPYLLTKAGTYKYDVTATNLSATALTKEFGGTAYAIRCKKILRVFIDVTNGASDYNKRWMDAPMFYRFRNPYNTATTRIDVAPVPVRIDQPTEDEPAHVEFVEDPGTTTEQNFCEFTWEMPRLVSESIPFPLPKRFEQAMYDYVRGSVIMSQTAKMNDFLNRFEEFWKREFHMQITSGASTDSGRVEPIDC